MAQQQEYKTKYTIDSPEIVDVDVLAPLDYEYKLRRDIEIVIDQTEFTSVCPMTGLPDYGCITIKYRPKNKIIELKSLKYYLLQYRNVGIFYEHVVNRILDDLVSKLDPKWMEITGAFTSRGGITTRVSAVYDEKAK
ncbi:MAG: NADPH-dependent 7-cyano-7-deazaguanine reductase QueF [Deltaproteobacteria bacterium]|nr:MAG: NADPH-dependent 7-cyano-7-deazaguanine reductase QueF [Deltaproteobacteria bacterium]